MNIIEKFNSGQRGENKGLSMGKGLRALSFILNGVQKARSYALAAAAKVGKSTLCDVGFVIEPWLDALANNIAIEFIYYSYEIDRISKEFDFICHFLFRDFGIEYISLPQGQTVKGQTVIPLSSDYLQGQVQDDNGKIVLVTADIQQKIIATYEKRIVPLFGEYNANGVQIKKGVITFFTKKEIPSSINHYLLSHAELQGTFTYANAIGPGGVTVRERVGYKPRDPKKVTIVIMDHLRKLPLEGRMNLKQTIDQYLAYSTELRNLCGLSFVHIIHLNRSMADVNRLKFLDDRLYPTSEDIKDTGNLSEECNYILTMMNPNDDKYNLKKHFGHIIKDVHNNTLYPNYRSIHLVESRHCPYPQHIAVNMRGGLKDFQPSPFT